jgi:hypothetical protein
MHLRGPSGLGPGPGLLVHRPSQLFIGHVVKRFCRRRGRGSSGCCDSSFLDLSGCRSSSDARPDVYATEPPSHSCLGSGTNVMPSSRIVTSQPPGILARRIRSSRISSLRPFVAPSRASQTLRFGRLDRSHHTSAVHEAEFPFVVDAPERVRIGPRRACYSCPG